MEELPDPLFFLSYARADNAEQHVRSFFNRLRESIRSKLGWPSSRKIGFLDLDIAQGEKWDADLLGSLGRTAAFIPLFSPTFFRREACGREWYVMQQRLVDHKTTHGTEPKAILPVLWQTLDEDAAREFKSALRYEWAFQFERAPAQAPAPAIPGIEPEPDTPEDWQNDRQIYEQQGLLGLCRRRRDNATQNVIEQLTAAVLAAAAPPGPLTATYRIPPLADTCNAFEPSRAYLEKSAGVGKLHIHVAAEEAPPREQTGPYRRKGGEYWIPYAKTEETGAKLAQDAAGELGLQTSSYTLNGNFAEFLEEKKLTNELVLVLVDPESLPGDLADGITRGSRFCSYMRSLDAGWINTIVLIPWDQDARHPEDYQRQMQTVANRLFANRRARRDELLLHSVGNHVVFKECLKQCLVKAINMTIDRSDYLAPPSTTYAPPVPNPHARRAGEGPLTP